MELRRPHPPERPLDPLPTLKLKLSVVILAAVLFAWLSWRISTRDRQPSSARLECKARYADARSFADTARVDGTYPTEYALERGYRQGPRTCGELRRQQLLP